MNNISRDWWLGNEYNKAMTNLAIGNTNHKVRPWQLSLEETMAGTVKIKQPKPGVTKRRYKRGNAVWYCRQCIEKLDNWVCPSCGVEYLARDAMPEVTALRILSEDKELPEVKYETYEFVPSLAEYIIPVFGQFIGKQPKFKHKNEEDELE